MRYNVQGMLIRSENAAKPSCQPCKFLLELIDSLPESYQSLDFGCGKLRYYQAAISKARNLTVVDSTVQIDRIQRLRGETSSIRSLLQHSNSVSVLNLKEFLRCSAVFDRAYCINLLSVIPIISVRERIIRRIFAKMVTGGIAIFVVQYRNSAFTRMLRQTNAQYWRGGILVDSVRGHSYYGLIKPTELAELVQESGFQRLETHLNGGSAYVLATKCSREVGGAGNN